MPRAFLFSILVSLAACGGAPPATAPASAPDPAARPGGRGWFCAPEGGPCAREIVDCEELAQSRASCTHTDRAHCFTLRVTSGTAFRCAATAAACAKARDAAASSAASDCAPWD